MGTQAILVAGLLFVRSLGFFMAGPLFSRRALPQRVKIVAAAALTVILFPLVPARQVPLMDSVPGALLVVLSEALLGALLGFAATIPFAGILLGGQLLGIQMGFSVSGVIDPQGGHSGGSLSRFLEISALLVFLLADGHHLLVRALVFSTRLHPPGTLFLAPSVGEGLVRLGGSLFLVALEVGGVVLGVLFLAEAAMGFVARVVPQMNVFIVAFPLKIALGLATMALTVPLYVASLNRLFAGLEEQLLALLRGI
jgi:flagellar biosynthetic protein FliR